MSTISSNIHVGDAGTALTVQVLDSGTAMDLSTATLLKIFIKRADGSVLEKTASLSTSGTDGKMQYVTTDDDLSVPGIYQIQGYVEFNTSNWSTEINKFRVYPNIG